MIIGFSGLAGSGKSTAAAVLEARGFRRVSFADPLKRMFAALGIERPAAGREGRELANPLLCGHSERHALQTLGTEWGRDCIGADFWVRLWAAEAMAHPHVVADDVRFPNEAAAIRQAGGQVFLLVRPGAGGGSGAGHTSEHQSFPVDAVIDNDGTPADLAARIAALLM